jgi:ELWxxDGT repeat protein
MDIKKHTPVFMHYILLACMLLLSACDLETTGSGNTNGMASLHISIPGVGNKKTTPKINSKNNKIDEAAVPAEINSIIIDVINNASTILDSVEIYSTGEATLNIPEGSLYTVRGRAFADGEVLFQGQAEVVDIIAGSNISVSLTLEDQIQLSLTSLTNIEAGSVGEIVSFNLNGLNDETIIWYVNNVEGGNSETGTIDSSGRYTPPEILPAQTRIQITAEPERAPSFAQSFSFDLLPPPVIEIPNVAPVANAGDDVTVNEQTTVNLSAVASNDSDGNIVSYLWVQISGAAVTITSADQQQASFIAPDITQTEVLVFQLTVTDDDGDTDSDTISITVNASSNVLPAVVAANDVTVNATDTVELAATASDADGTIASYSWAQISGDFNPSLSNADTASASFTAPSIQFGGSAVFQITVTDDFGASATDTLTVTVNGTDLPIVASAGANQNVVEAVTVSFDASGSNDPDNTITYAWVQLSGKTVSINSPAASNANFIAPAISVNEDLIFQLTVTNDAGLTATDTVTISVARDPANRINPVSNAGNDQTVTVGDTVTLSGSGTDADGFIVTYQWALVSDCPCPVLTNGNQASANFVAPAGTVGDFIEYRLIVTDNEGDTDTNTIRVNINVAVVAGDKIYFAATDSNGAPTLWITDGTSGNTVEVSTINVLNTDFSTFKTIGDYFYFHNFESVQRYGPQLSRTDGTTTEQIALQQDIRALDIVDSKLLYAAMTSFAAPNGNWEYFSYDTVTEITTSLFDAGASNQADIFEEHGVLNSFAYFAHNPVFVNTLYRADGVNPAEAVKTSIPGSLFGLDNIMRDFTKVGSLLYFVTQNNQLWKTDGTDAGTLLVKEFSGGNVGTVSGYETINNMIEFNNELYFVASDGVNGRELWRSAGTDATTVQISNLDATATDSNPQNFTVFNNVLYFFCSGNVNTNGLWTTDGTTATRLSNLEVGRDIYRAGVLGEPEWRPVVVDALNLMFFVASDDGAGREELWSTDGITTQKVVDTRTGFGAAIDLLKPGNGYLIFSGIDDDNRAKLWRTDGTTTIMIKDICPSCFGNATFDGPAPNG